MHPHDATPLVVVKTTWLLGQVQTNALRLFRLGEAVGGQLLQIPEVSLLKPDGQLQEGAAFAGLMSI